jgi:hypothetical protein
MGRTKTLRHTFVITSASGDEVDAILSAPFDWQVYMGKIKAVRMRHENGGTWVFATMRLQIHNGDPTERPTSQKYDSNTLTQGADGIDFAESPTDDFWNDELGAEARTFEVRGTGGPDGLDETLTATLTYTTSGGSGTSEVDLEVDCEMC